MHKFATCFALCGALLLVSNGCNSEAPAKTASEAKEEIVDAKDFYSKVPDQLKGVSSFGKPKSGST